MPLSNIQRCFHDLILDHGLEPGQILPGVIVEGGIPLTRRMQVYRDNITIGLVRIMTATFPVTDKLVGRSFFESMARAFVLAHPPQTGCLTWYGAEFDRFISEYEPAKTLPYLPDVARMEIAINESYYAPDDMPLTPAELAAVDPSKMAEIVLRPRASMRLVQSDFPINRIRQFCETNNPEATLDVSTGGERIFIFRPALKTEIMSPQSDEWDMMFALNQGQTLGAAVENVLARHPDFDLQGFLGRYLGLEALAALDTLHGGD